MQIGLLDRFIVVTFSLSEAQESNIIDYYNKLINIPIKNFKINNLNYKISNVEVKEDISLKPLTDLASKMNSILYDKYLQFVESKLSDDVKESIKDVKNRQKPSKIRYQQKLIMLCMGKVISEGRKELLESDIAEVIRLITKYTSLNFPFIDDNSKPVDISHLKVNGKFVNKEQEKELSAKKSHVA
jgi:hypothetical protein